MPTKYIMGLCLITALYSSTSFARIDHGKYHDYRASNQNAELQKMQEFHLQQAKTKLHSRQLTHAWGDLAYLLCHVPNHHLALQQMLTLTPQLHKENEMQDFLNTALDLFPEDPVIHVLYGAFLYNIGKDEDAQRHVNLAQQLEPLVMHSLWKEKNSIAQQ